jgi:hypothetical protein
VADLSELVSNLTNPDPKFHRLRCGGGGEDDDGYYSGDNGYNLLRSAKMSETQRLINLLYGPENLKQLQQSSSDMFLPSVEEYVTLFDSFATGASLSTTMTSYTGCRDGFVKAFRSIYYTINWYTQVFGGTDVSNANFFNYITNVTSAMSASTDFVSKCLTTAEDTTTSLADYIASFTTLSDYALAFLMNLTGNIATFYSVFQ